MDYSNYRHMKIERQERILTVMLNRPPMNPIHLIALVGPSASFRASALTFASSWSRGTA